MDEGKEGLRAAAEDLLAAIKGDDVEGLMSALGSFLEQQEMPEEGMAEGGLVGEEGNEGDIDADEWSDQRKQARYFGEY